MTVVMYTEANFMSASVRFMFFLVALFTMAFLALGSMLMAVGHHALLVTLSFVLGVLLAVFGFTMRRRFVKPPTVD